MKNPSYPRYTYCLLLCLQAVASGVEIPKLFNNTALNTAGAWNGGIPGTNDVMLWDATFVDTLSGAASLSPLGGDMSVQGIKVTNVGGTRNVAARLIGFQNPSSANTLTIGAGGIDMSTATQALLAQSKIVIGADQTWNIADANNQGNVMTFNNNEDLGIQSLIAAATFNLNGKTVTTTGNGYITISSGWVMSNGTFNSGNNLFVIQGGGSQLMNIQNTVNLNVNSGRLRLQSNSGTGGASLTSAATIAVNAGTLEFRGNNTPSLTQTGPITLNNGSAMAFIVDNTAPTTLSGSLNAAASTTIRMSGAGNPTTLPVISGALTGSGAIAFQNTATAAGGVLRLTGNNSGYTGTLTMNGLSGNRTLRLGSANAGSAAATWNITAANILQSEGLAISLGTLNGAGTVTNSHASNLATYTIDAGNFSGGITNGATANTAVTKVGTGTLVLSGPNTYSGTTTVTQGTLVDTPEHSNAGAVTVADGATFGTLLKTVDTTLSTGNLTVGTTTGATVQLDFGNLTNPSFAPLAVNNLFFHGPSTIKVVGKNLTTGTFPLMQYTTKDPGSTAVGGLTLALPTRTTGVLSDSANTISVNITGTQQVKWNGNVSNDWDIDPDGTGAIGTPNWLTTVTAASTRYIQGSVGTDVVTFDDTASGGAEKTVNLTATMSPNGLTFNNSTSNYTLTGPGKLSGLVGLEKNGTGMVTLANSATNDYAGTTLINAGSLRLGDGVTAGAGQITGAIQNEGTLILNRPDNFDFTNALAGAGTFEKAGPNTVSFTLNTNFTTPVKITSGKLKFNLGASLTGVLSGTGELESSAGNLDLGGSDPNTHTGRVNVTGGVLRLMKPEGVTAVGGDIYITGAATVSILANEQIANTATIHALGTSADSLAGSTGVETYGAAVVNGVATTQLIMRNSQVITGTATVNQGILGVASAHTGTVGAVVMTSPTAILRVAGGSAASFMNVGAGGITASAGDVQVKFSTTDQDATLNLAGDLTTTGNFAFTNAGYPGTNLNVVNLSGNRIFNIGAGTTTTFAPDLVSATDNLTKSGGGTLTLNASCIATIAGGTTVSAGTLLVNGSLAGGVTVDAAATLGGSGSIGGNALVNGTLSPGGTAIGALTGSGAVTFGPDSDLAIGIGSWTGTAAGVDWDAVNANTLAFTATAGNPLTIHISGTPTGFTETNKTLVIGTSTNLPTGFDAAAIVLDTAGFSGSGTWQVQLTGSNVELIYTAGLVSPYDAWANAAGLTGANNGPSDDPDKDGENNQLEFALSGNPLSGKANDKVVSKIASVGGQQRLTLTLPVRSGVTFGGSPSKNGAADGIVYTVEGNDDLQGLWELDVTEVTGADATAIQSGLPALPTGWTYKTFRVPGTANGDAKEFIRAVVNTAA